MARTRKLTAPQIKALRSALVDHFSTVTGHHDGMTIKALQARGYLTSGRSLTVEGSEALAEGDHGVNDAIILKMHFEEATYWHNGLGKACRRFCKDQHHTWTRDDLGNPIETTHHHTDLACCLALADAGMTWSRVTLAFS